MKQFLKFTLASIAGLLITGLVCFLLLVAIIGSLSSKEKAYNLQENSVLELDLTGEIVEQGQEGFIDLEKLGIPLGAEASKQGLDDLLSAIKKAGQLDEVKGIYLKVGTLNAGYATAEVLRDALVDFKKSGKYVVAYGNTYDQVDYYICSAADKLFLNPIGMVNWCGLVATPVFYTKTLEKLGVEMQVFKVGTFKSAVEPYTKTEMSPESRLQTTEYLNGMWNHVLSVVGKSRQLSSEKLDQLADENQLMKPTNDLLASRIVDSLVYESGMKAYLSKRNGVKSPKDLPVVSVSELLSIPDKHTGYMKDKIALLYAEGEISEQGQEGISAEAIIEEIETIRDNDNIKAVVFRINSPGGSAFASEQIWQALTELKAKKPIVVSMGNYAASGGYYIACNANKILASPNTLTGSIGIFAIFPNVEKLTSKIGLNIDVVKTNNLGDFGNLTRTINVIEREKIQRYIENGYNLFVKRCASGRKMKPEAIEKIAEGRVWTGEKAVELGLVDTLGGIDEAIEEAAKLAKIKDFQISYFPKKKDYMTILMETFSQQSKLKLALSLLDEDIAPLVKLRASGIQTGVLAKTDEWVIR